MMRFLDWVIVTMFVGQIHPIISVFTFFMAFYRTWDYYDVDSSRDSMGYKIIGYGTGYNPLYYVDWSDWEPPKKRNFFF